jgi:16S rRNA (adenine1518-N6/adenine1519-N6)-dimethyltransferase
VRRRFGQHFLHDTQVITQMLAAINPKMGQGFVEIGPGLGALTTHLLPLVGTLDVIELDRDIIPPLIKACHGLGTLNVHQGDALKFDFTQLAEKPASLRIVGNLPYQISTPLLFHLIEQKAVIQDLHFMLQKEVVDRLAANPGSKTYGRLSVMVQYHFQVYSLFTVGPEAFSPIPQVTSQVVRLLPKQIQEVAKNYPLFCTIVREAFNHRRKILSNSLQGLVTIDTLEQAGIDPHCRPEQLSVEDFVRITGKV